MLTVNTTWTNKNPNTVYNQLTAKLGSRPSNDEIMNEMRRILRGG